MIIVMAAANSTQLSWRIAGTRLSDVRLSSAVREAASLLQHNPPTDFQSSGTTVLVPSSGKDHPLQVLLISSRPVTADLMFPVLDGDTEYVVQAKAVTGGGPGRTAVFLVNRQGKRPAPILLSEHRI
jgi:hypothetical protein